MIESLKKILEEYDGESTYELYSDSAYVVNAINNCWLEKWLMNGWKTAKGDEVKNSDLWIKLLEARENLRGFSIEVNVIKVKGHSGNTFNELVDKVAREESMKAKEG